METLRGLHSRHVRFKKPNPRRPTQRSSLGVPSCPLARALSFLLTRNRHTYLPVCGLRSPGAGTMLVGVRGFLRYCRSPRGRLVVNLISGLLAVGVAVLAARHFAETGWPLAHADIRLLAAASGFFLLAYLFKALGWHRLFAESDKPSSMALAA